MFLSAITWGRVSGFFRKLAGATGGPQEWFYENAPQRFHIRIQARGKSGIVYVFPWGTDPENDLSNPMAYVHDGTGATRMQFEEQCRAVVEKSPRLGGALDVRGNYVIFTESGEYRVNFEVKQHEPFLKAINAQQQ